MANSLRSNNAIFFLNANSSQLSTSKSLQIETIFPMGSARRRFRLSQDGEGGRRRAVGAGLVVVGARGCFKTLGLEEIFCED